MTTDNFILAMAAYLAESGVPLPITVAARFVLDHEGIETDTTPEDAVQEWQAKQARR